jgi:hypothetical protein
VAKFLENLPRLLLRKLREVNIKTVVKKIGAVSENGKLMEQAQDEVWL